MVILEEGERRFGEEEVSLKDDHIGDTSSMTDGMIFAVSGIAIRNANQLPILYRYSKDIHLLICPTKCVRFYSNCRETTCF